MKPLPFLLLFILSILTACSGLETSETKKIRKRHLTIRPIQRQSDDVLFPKTLHPPKKRAPYPWEYKHIGSHLRITKEFFRCRGNPLNPPIGLHKEGKTTYHLDCGGIDSHTLPLKDGKEFIYPILIDLLNFIQEKTEKKVIITCGHRCPSHHLYADPSEKGRSSKHLIGAEVDFYVEGLERVPNEVVETLSKYYEAPLIRSSSITPGSTASWYNKEIALTLYSETQGRDFDNNHPYPYLSLSILYDKESGRPVHYSWDMAHNGYIKQ